MALFSLTDIKFNSDGPRTFQPQKSFDLNNKRYPSDLGAADKAHYMMFQIYIQDRTQFAKNYAEGDLRSTAVVNRASAPGTTVDQAIGTVYTLGKELFDSAVSKAFVPSTDFELANLGLQSETSIALASAALDAGKEISNRLKSGNLFRTTKRITDTIALYMPDTLNFQYSQSYSDTSITKEAGILGQIAQAGASAIDGYKNGGALGTVRNLSPFASEALSQLKGGDLAFTALSSLTGGILAKNPQLELIYSAPAFRSFNFQFMFYPRDEKEASEVIDIIELFKFHQAPEILVGSYGRFLVPPSEFDIRFMYNGQINPNIPTVSTCVLESIDVDYAPNGFAAYETGNDNTPIKGKTGMPVAIRLDLRFKEVEILTKRYFDNKSVSKSNQEKQNIENINGFV